LFTSFARCLVTTLLIVLLITTTTSATLVRGGNRFGLEHGVLRGVRIQMIDGRTLAGYVAWSRDYFKYAKEAKFPQSLLDPTAWVQETKALELYTRLYPVSKMVLRRAFPDGDGNMRMVIATASGTLRLPIKQIARIRALRMRYDGIEATTEGLITYIRSRTIIRLLMSGKPVATLMNDGGHVLVSFNRQIGRRKLAAFDAELNKLSTNAGAGILADFDKAWDQTVRRLERQRVVVILYIASG
jgi:hypothetical protein